tara:strand:+ start:140 stop:346 length:207 start_codon:yes stop_codon:yes gene_type:complete
MKTWDDFIKEHIKRNDCEINYHSTDLDKKSKSWEIVESMNENIKLLKKLNPDYKVILWENKLYLKDTY